MNLSDRWPAEASTDYVLVDSSGWMHLEDDAGNPLCRSARNHVPESRKRNRARGRYCPLCNYYALTDSAPDGGAPTTCPKCNISPTPQSSGDIFMHFDSSHGLDVEVSGGD